MRVLDGAYFPAADSLPGGRTELDKGLDSSPSPGGGPARLPGRPRCPYEALLENRSDGPAVAIGFDMAKSALNAVPDEVRPS